ncbi:hypothetical protein BC834DRAFT_890004 [Gloeopeniophorella convolvens]|nr:hypothetical protein BC834DRAFT_890004 [Gloeopeniophorella convolvens]
MDIPAYRVPGSSDTYYIPNFVTEDEENYLLRKIQETPQPKWKQLANRRLQTWGGDLTGKNVLVPQPFPPFLSNFPDIISRIASTGVFEGSPHQRPNHVILNEYHPGQGIMPHEDGPAYHPVVATLSLGSHTVMHYYRPLESTPALSLLLEPRSLVITTREQYTAHMHGIDGTAEDRVGDVEFANEALLGGVLPAEGEVLVRRTRYSFTCRDVARVVSIGPAKLGKRLGS